MTSTMTFRSEGGAEMTPSNRAEWLKMLMENTDEIARIVVMVSKTGLVNAMTTLTAAAHNDGMLAAVIVKGTYEKVRETHRFEKTKGYAGVMALKTLYETRRVMEGKE